jgi:3'-phosphoadenosine 5'-phosphosulfate sulfotransferase (PAPS reductase)/FAD synthetase
VLPETPETPGQEPPGQPDLASYDVVIVAFSGGKDSLACLLHLFDAGVPREKIELWHHDVDGREGSTLMDWPCTRDYCRKVAEALGVRLYFSWKEGGFEREMCRDGTATSKICFEVPDWPGGKTVASAGGNGPPGTRKKFPQVSPDLSVRWCSAYLKIDVGAAALRNQPRFAGKRTLFVTGERAEESSGRAKYKAVEPHRSDLRAGKARRLVDQWRPVHAWREREVWEIIKKYRVVPHPAYVLGWGRVSCAACIFGSKDQFASLRAVNPTQFEQVAEYEARWGLTIKRKGSLRVLADSGTPYGTLEKNPDAVRAALSKEYTGSAVLLETESWSLPAGAFGESCGPT